MASFNFTLHEIIGSWQLLTELHTTFGGSCARRPPHQHAFFTNCRTALESKGGSGRMEVISLQLGTTVKCCTLHVSLLKGEVHLRCLCLKAKGRGGMLHRAEMCIWAEELQAFTLESVPTFAESSGGLPAGFAGLVFKALAMHWVHKEKQLSLLHEPNLCFPVSLLPVHRYCYFGLAFGNLRLLRLGSDCHGDSYYK